VIEFPHPLLRDFTQPRSFEETGHFEAQKQVPPRIHELSGRQFRFGSKPILIG